MNAAADKLRSKREAKAQELAQVFELSKSLQRIAAERMCQVAADLENEIRTVNSRARCTCHSSGPDNGHWFWDQVVTIATKFGYYADLRTYHAWVRLKIQEERQAELIISFHPVGNEFLGIMATTAFIEYRMRGEGDEAKIDGPYPVCRDIFEFSYNESSTTVEDRFTRWLNATVLNGLDQWRRQL